MKFLAPVGGWVSDAFGILTTPGHKGIPAGIVAGLPWAADNQAFTQGFDAGVFFPWLDGLLRYRASCLFVPVPDVVGNAAATIDSYWRWFQHFTGWPLAFVGQDGQEALEFPGDEWSTLFIGGTTEWKLSSACDDVIRRAQALGKAIHIGRVNWGERYRHFAMMSGSEEWTCDGTRTRFDGTRRTLAAWSGYMAQRPLFRYVPGGDSGG